jgi:hypothetical protein
MERLIETNIDKKAVLEMEKKWKLMQDKNRALITEVGFLRKEVDHKEIEMEKI